jgi:prepilin-type processing-associated H-X9-DG protein
MRPRIAPARDGEDENGYRAGSAHANGLNVLLADGSVRSVSYNISATNWYYLCHASDGQVPNF